MRIGYEAFHRSPGEVDEQKCLVCGTVCNIQRNVKGPTSFAMASMGKKVIHDYFVCPYSKEGWHNKALSLVSEMNATVSDNLKALIKEDLDRVIKEKA